MINRTKLLAVLLASTLAIIAVVGHLIWSSYHDTIDTARITTQNYAAILHARLDATLRRVDSNLQQLALGMRSTALNTESASRDSQINSELKTRLIGFPEVAGIAIFDANGDTLYSSYDHTLRPNIADRSHFKALRDDLRTSIVFSEVIVARNTGQAGFTVSRPLRDTQGVFQGAVVALIDLNYFLQLFKSLDVGNAGVIAVYRSDVYTQVLRWPAVAGRLNAVLPADTPARTLLANGVRTATYNLRASTDKITRIYSAHALAHYPFFLSVGVSRDEVLAAWRTRSLAVVLSALLATGLLFGLFYRLSSAHVLLRETEVRFRNTFEHAALGIAHIQAGTFRILMTNDRFCNLLGYAQGELTGADSRTLTPAAEMPARDAERAQILEGKTAISTVDRRLIRKDGSTHWFSRSLSLVRDAAGAPAYFISVLEDIGARKHAEAQLHLQKEVLECVASSATLDKTLGVLARAVETQAGDVLCSILLLDKDGLHLRHGAAPSLPDAYNRAIDGISIGPAVGSCGTAAYRRTPVIVEDIAHDPLWRDFRVFALAHGLRACWSTPIIDARRKLLGTFAIYYRERGRPTEKHLELIRLATDLAVIAIGEHETEAALAESEARFRSTFEQAAVGIAHFDLQEINIKVNRRYCEITGYSAQELLGKPAMLFSRPDDRGSSSHLRAQLRAGAIDHFSSDKRYIRKDGKEVWVTRTESLARDANGAPLYIIRVIEDITERKRAEAALNKASQRLDIALEGSQISIWETDLSTNKIWLDANWAAYLGHAPKPTSTNAAELLTLVHPDDRRIVAETAVKCMKGQISEYSIDHRVRSANGKWLWIQSRGRVTEFDSGGRALRMSGTNTDITERKMAEAERSLLATIVENASDVIISRTLDGTIVSWNAAAEQMFGYSAAEAIGRPIKIIMPAAEEHIVAEHSAMLAAGNAMRSSEAARLTKDGRVVHVIRSISPVRNDNQEVVGAAIIMHDISALKQAEAARASLEAQLRESQKMQAIGTLAGGIAHDFNNIIAIILGNVTLARRDAGQHPHLLESLDRIRSAGVRARDLVRQILAFSRRQPTTLAAVSLGPVMEETARLLRATMPARVSLQMHCDPDVPRVLADATQIQQALINLATNAMQAIGDGAGRISMRLDSLAPGDQHLQSQAVLHKRFQDHVHRVVRLSVSDTGPGMDKATLERVFEPFFTTKPSGEGTGLGLSVVHGIAEGHGGSITVESEPGCGATFTLYLPAAAAPIDAPAEAAHADAARTPDKRGNLHILYVDDDEDLALLVTRLLEGNGYRISAYTNPRKALAALRAAPRDFDLVLSDYNMPGMSGLDVARESRSIRADLPVAVTSGFIDENLRAQAAAANIRELIFKADSVEAFCETVERLAAAVSAKTEAS